jgi:hypothetical protein
MKRATASACLLLLLQWGFPVRGLAYDIGSHRAFSAKAAQESVALDAALKDLDFSAGRDTLFSDREGAEPLTAVQWVQEGGESEDVPFLRVLNHFHNPLRSWDEAGLRVGGLQIGQSAVLWGQNINQGLLEDGTWSWPLARQRFLLGLVGDSRTERDHAFADTFRALGQVSHLIQDAAVPAHARDDAHPSLPSPFGLAIPLNPDWYEDWVEEARAKNSSENVFNDLLALPARRPLPSVFRPSGSPQASAPIAGLIDTTQFIHTGVVDGPLAPADVGMSEFSNGNFLSRSTLFKNFALPRVSALGQGFFELVDPAHPSTSKFRRYFSKVVEGTSAIEIEHFVTEGALYQSLSSIVGTPPSAGWLLDSRVHRDYAAELLPRAVGYSAALLDYFFRGKLEVTVELGPDDLTLARILGRNASPESLVAGNLALYTETAAGVRTAAPAVTEQLISADPDGALESGQFRVTDGIDRFIAVYRGQLGDETPGPTSSGAVIGKAGRAAIRVEEVFSDGAHWQLRTADGLFPLPVAASTIQELVWGDSDGTLVGRTPFGVGAPNTFFAYSFERDPVSGQPLLDGSGQVVLTQMSSASFPVGLDLGTTVQLSQTIHFQQYLPIFLRTVFIDPAIGVPTSQHIDASDPGLVVDQTRTVTRMARLLLDLNKLNNSRGTPHSWKLRQIGLTSDGRILALVASTLRLRDDFEAFSTKRYVATACYPCPTEDGGTFTVSVSFPTSGFDSTVVAVIDVTNAAVLTSTAPAVIDLRHTTQAVLTSEIPTDSSLRVTEVQHVTGPNSDSGLGFPRAWPTVACSPPQTQSAGVLQLIRGTTATEIHQYRPEIATVVAGTVVLPTSLSQTLCVDIVPSWAQSGLPAVTITVNTANNLLVANRLADGLRARSDLGRIVLSSIGIPDNSSVATQRVVSWNPSEPSATMRAERGDVGSLISTARSTALLRTSAGIAVIPLDGERPVREFPMSQTQAAAFLIVEPAYLFNTGDSRLYSTSPALQATSVAPPLVPGNALGNYHSRVLK